MAERRPPRKKKVVPGAADEPHRPRSPEELRRGAEQRLDELSAASPAPEELAAAVHELRVHKIELEMQNDELRHAQLELEEQREKYFELFDQAPVGYLTLNDTGIVGEANFTAAHLLGVERRLLVGQHFSAVVLAADRDAYYLHHRRLQQSGEPQSCELRLYCADGEAESGEFWAHLESRRQGAGDGEQWRHQITVTDVTQRVVEAQRLRESEAKYREVVERATDGIAILQGDLVIFANEALARMSGYSVGELTGMPFRDSVQDRRREIEQRDRNRRAGEDLPDNGEIVLLRKDGTPFTVELSAGIISYEGAPGELVLLRDVTARKRAEEELRETRDFLESLLGHAGAPIIVWDAEQRIVRFNQAFEELSGLTAGEVVGKHVGLLFPGDERSAQVIELAARVAAGERLPVVEIPVVRPDGEVRTVLWASSTLYADDGVTPVATIAQGQDVSARKQAEEALRLSEERHRAMFERNRAVKLVIDPETAAIVDASPAACEFYGYTRDELLARKITDLNTAPEATVREEMLRAISERVTHFDFGHRLASGEVREVEVNSGPFETGGRTLLFSIVHDVTERRQAEEALREASDRLSLATRAGGVGIWDYDVINDTLTWDEQMFALYGITREQFGGAYEAWQAGLHPDDRERGDAEIQLALRGEQEFDTEFRVLWPDGTTRDIHALALVQRDASGRATRMIGTNWDITEARRAEEEIQQRNQELGRLNEELASEAAALAAANATITRIAATDVLTGLANRRHFYEVLEKAVSLARRHGSPLAVVSLDLDGLKPVNDSSGHEAGDEVLASFAALLVALCRSEDLPARLGGDEFSVLLPGDDLGGAQGFAERALTAVRACDLLARRGVTVSGGVAQWAPGELPDDLLRRADVALYVAKRDGGDAVSGDA